MEFDTEDQVLFFFISDVFEKGQISTKLLIYLQRLPSAHLELESSWQVRAEVDQLVNSNRCNPYRLAQTRLTQLYPNCFGFEYTFSMQRFQTFFPVPFNICCANIYYYYTIQPCLQDYQLWVLLLLYFSS